MQNLKNVHELMRIYFAMYTFIQLSLKEIFHLNVQAIIINLKG